MTALPPSLYGCFSDIDENALTLSFIALSHRIAAVLERSNLSGVELPIVQAEHFVIGLSSSRSSGKTRWGLYFGPRWTIGATEFPDRAMLCAAYLDHWVSRCRESQAPVLVARYADSAWELRGDVKGARVEVEVAHRAISAYLKCARSPEQPWQRIRNCERALQLAVSLSDEKLVRQALDAILEVAGQSAESVPATTNRVIRTLVGYRKKLDLSDPRIEDLAGQLVSSLDALDSPMPPVPNFPQLCSNVKTLQSYEGARNRQSEADAHVERLAVGAMSIAIHVEPPLAASWITNAIELCTSPNLRERLNELQVALEQANTLSMEHMTEFSTRMTISQQERADFERDLVKGGLVPAVSRWLRIFRPTMDMARERLKQEATQHPLLHLIETNVMDGRHVRARVGGILDDEVGQLVHSQSATMVFEAPFMRMAMNALRREFSFGAHTFVALLQNSVAFDGHRSTIFNLGFDHYVRGDYTSAIHLLVPQVEHLFRGILKSCGVTRSVPAADGSYKERQLGGLLKHTDIKRHVSEDTLWYTECLLTDPRGWNLRNKVCHALIPDSEFTRTACERVIHLTMLVAFEALPSGSSDGK